MKKIAFIASSLLSTTIPAHAEDYNKPDIQLIGERDPDISEDFVRNIFTKKELPKSSIFVKSEPESMNVVLIYSKVSMYSFSLVDGRRVARCQTPCEIPIPANAPFLIRVWKENYSASLITPPPEWKLKIPGAPGFGKKLKNNVMIYKTVASPKAPKSEDEIFDE